MYFYKMEKKNKMQPSIKKSGILTKAHELH